MHPQIWNIYQQLARTSEQTNAVGLRTIFSSINFITENKGLPSIQVCTFVSVCMHCMQITRIIKNNTKASATCMYTMPHVWCMYTYMCVCMHFTHEKWTSFSHQHNSVLVLAPKLISPVNAVPTFPRHRHMISKSKCNMYVCVYTCMDAYLPVA